MSAKVNQGQYKRLENEWGRKLAEGKEVQIDISPIYEETSSRPIGFDIKYKVIDKNNKVNEFISFIEN